MGTNLLQSKSLNLVLLTKEETLAMVEGLSPEDRAQVSPAWLEQLQASPSSDPWTHGFSMMHRETGVPVGSCGFKGPPDAEGVVEIAYGVEPEQQGRGYATEAAQALVDFAFASEGVRLVRAHTFRVENASTRVLTKCGFRFVGEVIDPDDGLVYRWEKRQVKSE